MTKISKIAIRKPSGKVVSGPIGKHHVDLHTQGKRGFMTDGGKFVNRGDGAKIATKANQVKSATKSLHSHELKKPTRSKSK